MDRRRAVVLSAPIKRRKAAINHRTPKRTLGKVPIVRPLALLLSVMAAVLSDVGAAAAENEHPRIGESEGIYQLASDNTQTRGLAVDDSSADAPRLFVLDASSKVFAYQIDLDAARPADALKLLRVHALPTDADGARLANPRGLAFAVEDGHDVFYFLNWDDPGGAITSQLWRWNVADSVSTSVDLSLYHFRIGDRETLDVANDGGDILVCFDGSGYTDHNLRVQRGIVRLRWNQASENKLEFLRHMPDSGTDPARGLGCMQLEGARYLWATVGDEYIYCADALTGRGLFHFDRPKLAEGTESDSSWGLCFGNDALWVSENVPGPDRVHRVNVTKNLDAFSEGPRVLRHLTMTIETEPEGVCDDPGKAYHYYSRPYAYDQLHNQGIWPETERLIDVSAAPNATLKSITYDPAGDSSSRQHMKCVEYASAPARAYSSKYEIDFWTNSCRKFVYPHRADRDVKALEGTDYLADDPDLFNLADTKTYGDFGERVRRHVEAKYGVAADMKNPYWAARNTLEYIQDCYYYPSRPKRKPAAVDYARKHYDANPGNLKIELSAREYDKSQIIACSGTSVMLAGAMRYLGIPARWLGTGTEQKPESWDANGNGLLDEEETAGCTNGHRYTQVWLGDRYGWICFDATPSKPAANDYDPPPPIQPQWRYMNRAAAGHMREKRVVFNVGSALYRPLYREFEYDERLAVDNNCGGDQRYNVQGRFDKPELWELAGHRIAMKNLCFVKDVAVCGPKGESLVTWKLKGAWNRDPDATVSVYLQQMDPDTNEPKDVARVAEAIPHGARSTAVDLSDYCGKRCRVIVRKDGDPETGGHSDLFVLE